MNHLIIISHPKKESFSQEITTELKKKYEAMGHQVAIRDLYEINFGPVLTEEEQKKNKQGDICQEVIAEQGHIQWADVITVIYPLWWNAFPAILKGYIDRVFTNGFAFQIGPKGPEGLLKGKRVQLITTAGMDEEALVSSKIYEGLKITQDHGVFEFCGMEVLEHMYVTSVTSLSDDEKKNVLQQMVSKVVENESVKM